MIFCGLSLACLRSCVALTMRRLSVMCLVPFRYCIPQLSFRYCIPQHTHHGHQSREYVYFLTLLLALFPAWLQLTGGTSPIVAPQVQWRGQEEW